MTAAAAPPAAAANGAANGAAPAKRKSKRPLILGLVLALAGGAGGFFAVGQGLLDGLLGRGGEGGGAEDGHGAMAAHGDMPAIEAAAFVALPPLTVNLRGVEGGRFLRFAGQLEVAPEHLHEVEGLVPRVVDVLNGYLRAIEPGDLADPAALMAIRSQLLRRAQVVAGGDRVRNLLVMEFVIN